MYLSILGVILFIAVILIAGMFQMKDSVKNLPMRKMEVRVGNVKIFADIADNAILRTRGLSGRGLLPENSGMLFLFYKEDKYSFWMKEMNFPIDIIWIKNGEVLSIEKNAEPEPGVLFYNLQKYYPPEPVDTVLEINAGKADEWGIKEGDKVSFEF